MDLPINKAQAVAFGANFCVAHFIPHVSKQGFGISHFHFFFVKKKISINPFLPKKKKWHSGN